MIRWGVPIMMQEHGFHHLPVTEGGQVVGILSESELRHVGGPFTGISSVSDLLVKDICNTRVFTIDIHDRLDLVMAVMAEKHVDAAVVTRMGKLAGILTASDAMRKFLSRCWRPCAHLPEAGKPPDPWPCLRAPKSLLRPAEVSPYS